MDNSGLQSDNLTRLVIDGTGNVYVASHLFPAGLSVYNGSGWTNYTEANSNLASDFISDLEPDTSGIKIWIATNSSVSSLVDNVSTEYNRYAFFEWDMSPDGQSGIHY